MKRVARSIIWIMIAIFIALMLNSIRTPVQASPKKEISYSEFLDKVEGDSISGVVIKESTIEGQYDDGSGKPAHFVTFAVEDQELIKTLREHKVNFTVQPPAKWLGGFFTFVLPMLLFVVFYWFIFRQMKNPADRAFSFGKSKAKLQNPEQQKITFKDVAGVDEAKEELKEIIEFLKDPGKFRKLGGKIPKGVLLLGPPGCGKTLLARAVAGEANVPFFNISGSDFVEMFVGVGASRVRDLFEQAKKSAPSLIFIDEIDAVGRQRFAGIGGGHDEREQTLNQLLVEMDGFDTKEGVILIAATNRPDVLDPALLRMGRFDRNIIVNPPDIIGREEILKVHMRNVKLAPELDVKVLARRTPGFVGSDLANMVNEAALLAARKGKESVGMEEFSEAVERVIAGPEMKTRVISEREKKIVAYHESGHTLIAKLIPGTDPVHKVSIIPRGIAAMGYTLQLPLEDRYLTTRTEVLDRMTVMFGGRVAEELVFNEVTTGAQNDLEKISEAAHKMVCEYGMSKKMGPITYRKKEEMVFLGRDITKEKQYSEEVASQIDREIRRIIEECYKRAKDLLKNNSDKLDKLAKALIEKEMLEEQEVDEILKAN